jgi:4-hydroxybenzoate polyprenyltransferase
VSSRVSANPQNGLQPNAFDPDRTGAAAADEDVARAGVARVAEPPLPLIIDLDAAITSRALGWEIALCVLRRHPAAAFAVARSAFRGRDALEREACAREDVDFGALPLDASALSAARQAAAEGRPVVLLTSRHEALAHRLRQAHPSVSEVIAAADGDDVAELSRTAAVRSRCPAGFVVLPDQVGRAPWSRTASPYLPASAAAIAPDDPTRPSMGRTWAKAARLHQWSKNLLVFVPLFLAGQALDPHAWIMAAAGFLAFGLVASATYLMNDLHDLPHDRAHWSKRHRPLAAGRLTIPHALAAIAALIMLGTSLASVGGLWGLGTLAAYLVLTTAYTFLIKRYAVLDAVTLAALFTLRLVAGIAFCGVAGSPWLLALSMFVFTSLALAKRSVEIGQLAQNNLTSISGRGYAVVDAPVVLSLGAATSTAAVLIFALYVFEAAARHAFYVNPDILWAAPVALFLWLGRIWMLCGRGALRDDPVEFAVTDKVSIALGIVVFASFALACVRIA